MKIYFSKEFKRSYKKLPNKIRIQCSNRIELFSDNPDHPLLNNHKLQGDIGGYYSINISGDIRAIYEKVEKDLFLFLKLGTHSQLY